MKQAVLTICTLALVLCGALFGLRTASPALVPAASAATACSRVDLLPCPECPTAQVGECVPDSAGIYTGCTMITISCSGGTCKTAHTSTGPSCPNP